MLFRFATIIIALATLQACSSLEFPWVYRISVQQGNIIDQEAVDKLELGMTKRQVQFVMGSPLLIDTFSQDRWDYYYSRRDGKGNTEDKRFTVYFKDDRYVSYDGSVAPSPEKTSANDTLETDEDTKKVISNPEDVINDNSVY